MRMRSRCVLLVLSYFFNDTTTTEIYTLSHTTLFRSPRRRAPPAPATRRAPAAWRPSRPWPCRADRKSTRLNSSHANISYAVFCLKKKKDWDAKESHELIEEMIVTALTIDRDLFRVAD